MEQSNDEFAPKPVLPSISPISITELLPQVRSILPLDNVDALNRMCSTLCDVIERCVAAPVHGAGASAEMRLTVAARREAAVKLVSSGMSHEQAAKVLNVDRSTVTRDVRSALRIGAKRTAKEAEIKAANAKLELVKPAPAPDSRP